MRVLMEYFVRPGSLNDSTLSHRLNKVIWVRPFLGWKRDQVAKELKNLGLSEERLALVVNPIDPNGVKGVIFLDRYFGIFDEDLAEDLESRENEKGTGSCVSRSKRPMITDKSLVSLRQTIDWQLKKADLKFDEAKKSQDELRNLLTIGASNYDVEKIAEQLIDLLQHDEKQAGDTFFLKDAIYGAFTAKGPRYLTYPLPPDVNRWVILKGVAEIEISQVISKVKAWAEGAGLLVQADQCPLYRGEFDRLLLPSLGVGIIDGNRHHPFEPLSPNDCVIDLDAIVLNQEKVYYYAPEIRELQASYKQKMRQGTLDLQEAAQNFWAFNQMFDPIDLHSLLNT